MCGEFCSRMIELRDHLQKKEMELEENCVQLDEAATRSKLLSDGQRLLRHIQPNMTARDLLAALS